MSGTTVTVVIFAAIALAGLLIGLLGYKSSKLVLSAVGLLAGAAAVVWVGFLLNMPRTSGVILYAALGIGVVVGAIAMKFRRLAYGAAGVVFGGVLSITCLHIANVVLHYAIPPMAISIACGAIMVLFAFLFILKNKLALLLSTSFAGGYLFAFSVMLAILIGFGSTEIVSPLVSFPEWVTAVESAFIGFNTIIQLLILAICLFSGLLFTLLQSEFRSRRHRAKAVSPRQKRPEIEAPERRTPDAQRQKQSARTARSRSEGRPPKQEPHQQDTYDDFAASYSDSFSSEDAREMDFGSPSPVRRYKRADGIEYQAPIRSEQKEPAQEEDAQAEKPEQDRASEASKKDCPVQEEPAAPQTFMPRRSLSDVAKKRPLR